MVSRRVNQRLGAEPCLELLDRVVDHPRLGPVDRAMALITRADALEKLGRNADAAATLQQVLALLKKAGSPAIYGADPKSLHQRVSRLRR
jgi:predicted RNA polymerase sigma factor